MLNLNTNLNSVGISAAKGIELITKRDELSATLPRGGSAANATNSDAAAAEKKTQQASKTELSTEQQQQVRELQVIDQKVRAHEQAHLAAGRELIVSGPDYSYTYGPDGKRYATAGEVGIDTSAEREPEENIDKGQRIQATALAPADPSPQDYRAASLGSRLESEGRRDLVVQQQSERAAEQQGARQDGAAELAQPGQSVEPAAAESNLPPGGQNARDLRQLIESAYTSGAGGSASASQVSLFA